MHNAYVRLKLGLFWMMMTSHYAASETSLVSKDLFSPSTDMNTLLQLERKRIFNNSGLLTDEEIFVWRKDMMTAREFQDRYCGDRCGNETEKCEEIRSGKLYCRSVACMPCGCRSPQCQIYGNCCPGINHNNGTLTHNSSGMVDLECNDLYTTGDVHLYIASCPAGYSGASETVKLCQEIPSVDNITLDLIARAYDDTTQVMYRNKYCALCNGVLDPNQLTVTASCRTFRKIYSATTYEEILRRILQSDTSCELYQDVFSRVTHVQGCAPKSYTYPRDVKRICESQDDPDVVKACGEMTDYSDLVYDRSTRQIYGNLFCAICNMKSYPRIASNCDCHHDDASPGPLSILLNVREDHSMAEKSQKVYKSQTGCSDSHWLSPDGTCAPLHCSPGKTLMNRSCISALKEFKGMMYLLDTWLISNDDITDTSGLTLSYNDIGNQGNGIEYKLKKILELFCTDVMIAIQSVAMAAPTDTVLYNSSEQNIFLISLCLVSNIEIDKDQLELALSRSFFSNNLDQVVPDIGTLNMTFYTMKSFHNETNQHLFSVIKYVIILETSIDFGEFDNSTENFPFIILTPMLSCSFVSFNSTRYTVQPIDSFPPTVNITLTLGKVELNFWKIPELNMLEVTSDGVLNICKETLEEKVKGVPGVEPQVRGPRQSGQYLLTLVCCGISMLCLCLTLMTYALIPELRNLVGKYNMFLSTSILLAQTSLLATTHVKDPSYLCQVIGVSTHFLWLWMFVWTFICTSHAFTVFRSTRVVSLVSSHEELCMLTKRVVFSLAVPASIVTTVVVSSLATSGYTTIGYGNGRCYLNSPFLITVSMVVPLAIIVLCIVGLFVPTLITIYTTRAMMADRYNRVNDLYMYIKLSTSTGAFWTVAILSEVTDNDVLRYISIVLNGLQGVAIFTSYITNKEVMLLCHKRVVKTEDHVTSIAEFRT